MEKELGNRAFDYKPYVCDVTDAKQVDGVIGSVKLRFGRIDLLWNNAGYQGKIKPLLNYDPDDFKLVMDINVSGMFKEECRQILDAALAYQRVSKYLYS